MKHRLCFDVKTKLLVRMQFQWLKDDVLRKEIGNHFKWNPELPTDIFIHKIPKNFKSVESNGK